MKIIQMNRSSKTKMIHKVEVIAERTKHNLRRRKPHNETICTIALTYLMDKNSSVRYTLINIYIVKNIFISTKIMNKKKRKYTKYFRYNY